MKWFAFFIIVFHSTMVHASTLSSEQQKRANHFYEIVRCPVCDGQSLAGSEATIAQDLRRVIDEKILNDASDTEIKQDLITMYGQDILFEPPINKKTFLLNYGVYGVLFISFLFFLHRHRHKQNKG